MRDKAYNAALTTCGIVLGVSGFFMPVFVLHMPALSAFMLLVFVFDLGFIISLTFFGKSEYDSYMAGKLDGMEINDRLHEYDDIIRMAHQRGHPPIRPVRK